MTITTGLESVLEEPGILRSRGRLGLLYNQASVDKNFQSAAELLADAFPGQVHILFGPQHGVYCTEQDNMRETAHAIHPRLGLPIVSLYSDDRRPSRAVIEPLDAVVVDLQDVGTRVYTFATTAVYVMQACAELDKEVIVLDRPNPINGVDVEGNISRADFASFVAPYPLPMRHGMTMGELMHYYNEAHGIGCKLTVVPMRGWERWMWFKDTGLPWVLPSPNMPTFDTAVVYPGQVIIEGTNLSEGRGTTKPFEFVGAPYVDPERVLSAIDPAAIAGVRLRAIEFRPTFHKWKDCVCKGFQLHVVDRALFRPARTSLALVSAIMRTHPADFSWASPPYEYVFDKLPIDVIMGDDSVREYLQSGRPVAELEDQWREELRRFDAARRPFLLYS
ncbi:MAG: exo-beta-N-acetylmuramidase NamZ family protein [Desulfomonilaceae bacterium]